MTLTELRYIVTLAREQHFGHAAERCFVSQPTLSIAVKKLEDELGVERVGDGEHDVGTAAVEHAHADPVGDQRLDPDLAVRPCFASASRCGGPPLNSRSERTRRPWQRASRE